jgi:micrococcal nuclease
MKNIISKYQGLQPKYQIIITALIFIIALLILPNTIVYAIATVFYFKTINKKKWKYLVTFILGLTTFFSFILLIADYIPDSQVLDNVQTIQKTIQGNEVFPNLKETKTSDESAKTDEGQRAENSSTQTSNSDNQETPVQYTYYSVTQVVDGDTVKLSIDGKEETLRLIGLDTPETLDPRKPVQCFGKEASNKAKELLSGKKVRIEKDASQGEIDKYGRMLAYIYREDGLFYNKYMIEQGYAHEYTYNTPYKYQSEFKTAQKNAQNSQLGLWSPTTCNGDTTSANITPSTTNTQTTQADTQSGEKYYTSSHYSSKYYYPELCDGWKSLSPTYLKSYNTLEALLSVYPSKTKSPQCQ